ncbi:MAG: hypothetical protein JWM80_5022, partial [Cyanobacteria bacterium RYN_339]|nr:hypothetical protein [Cyanobacteria bacterium RYN_339]
MQFVQPWAGAFRLQTFLKATPDALPAETVEAIRHEIMNSPFLGVTQLEG